MSEELKVDVQEVIKLVKEKGYDRKQVAEHYGVSLKFCREVIFAHPELKGIRKPQKNAVQKTVVFVNASEGTETAEETETSTETAEETAKEVPSEETVSKSNADLPGETKEEASEEEEEVAHTPHFSAEESEEEETTEEEEEESEEEETTEESEEAASEDKPSSVNW
jgi:N-acetylmuramoyl-L-alanine amidase CwlA